MLDINRTGKQCRERFKSHLSSKIKKGDWTPAEDKIILEMKKKLGNCWTRIAKLLPGRSDNAVKNRCRSIEKNPVMERRSCSNIKQQKIDIESFVYSHFGQEHCIYDRHDYRPVSRMVAPMDLHQHCDHEVEQASEDEFSVDCEANKSSTGTIIDNAKAKIGWFEDDWVADDVIQITHQLDILNEEKACDAMQARDEYDFSVDGEENNPSTGTIIEKAEAKIGWLEDDWWVDDVIQITHQLNICNEEKACDAMMVTPSPRNPTTPIFTADNLFHSMSLIHVSYPTLDINMSIGSTKPTPRYRTVCLK